MGEEKGKASRDITTEKLFSYREPEELDIGLAIEVRRLVRVDEMSYINKRGARRYPTKSDLVGYILADWLSQSTAERTERARNGRKIVAEKLKFPDAQHFHLTPDPSPEPKPKPGRGKSSPVKASARGLNSVVDVGDGHEKGGGKKKLAGHNIPVA